MTYSTSAAKGLDVGFVDTLYGGEGRTEDGGMILVHAFLDKIWGLMFILLKYREIQCGFFNSAV
jgi:hypothetical protein